MANTNSNMEITFLGIELIFSVLLAFLVIIAVYFLFNDRFIENAKEKYVFITGCDSGFGKMLAETLDQDGVNVFAACLTEQGETTLKEACSSKVKTLRLDVTKQDQISAALAFVEENLPKERG